MKKEIVILNGRGESMRVSALVVTHPHPTIGAVGIHKSLPGSASTWSATHVRSGLRITRGDTRKSLVEEMTTREFTDSQLAIVAAAADAPEMEETTPPAPQKETRKSVDLDPIIDAVNQVVTLSDRERKAVRDALSSRSGRLKASAPVESWAKAAWNGLQPNPWKFQVASVMFLPDGPRAFHDRLSEFKWPVALDKDIESLTRMGVA